MSPNGGGGGGCGISANGDSCAHGAKINFGDLNPYLIYDRGPLPSLRNKFSDENSKDRSVIIFLGNPRISAKLIFKSTENDT
jgi:hypothetical protein